MVEVRYHRCCWNAQRFLFGYPGSDGIAWKLVLDYLGAVFVVVLHCPWCGVELLEGD